MTDTGYVEGKEVAWDLRQGYAELLRLTLMNIKMYRESRDYKNWFEELDGLFIDMSMKLKDTEIKEYKNMLEVLDKIIDKEEKAYRSPNIESENIYNNLKELNMWLMSKMQHYDLFGSKREAEGLV